MKAFPCLMALAATAALCRGESVTLYPSQDSDVYSYTDMPTSTIYTLGVSASGTGAPHSQRSLIQFNFTPLTIPAAEIGTAVLRLYVVATDPIYGNLSPGNVSVYSQEKAWSVSAPKVTPVTPKWNAFSPGDFLGTLPILSTSTDKWVELDITALAKTWVSGAKANYGIELMPESETASPALNVSFASMEVNGLGGTVGPQLVITRATAPVTPIAPPVLAIAATGDQITLSWSEATEAGWTLQQAASPAGPWTADATTPVVVGGQWQVTHSTTSEPAGFFRLIK